MPRNPWSRPRGRRSMRLLAAVLCAALLWPVAARADDTAAFLEASAEAYAPYRGAVSYLHTGNAGVAALALEAMASRWAELCDRFRDAPPKAFAEDPAWRASLDAITARIEAARTKLEAGDTEGAEAALAPIRGLLGELRRRNGIETHSDRVDALSAAMDTIWVHRHNPPDMTEPETIAAISEQARALRRALEAVAAEPPKTVAGDLQFQRLVEGSFQSIDLLDRAVEKRDQAFLISALRELRSFVQLMWMNFG